MDQRILVSQATPGMTLPDRMVLVGEGAVLSDVMITQMLKRGIKRIVVKGMPVVRPTLGDFDARVRALEERFARVAHLPLMTALRGIIARNMAKRA